ncbi:MAG TPA: aspartate/glutamate racemase family protein [Jiangellaceae bacterium]|nr:aspartate/glutamate racemase family protein [Jiangellaceae bacterium]
MPTTSTLRLRAITPIHVDDAELARRRVRYTALAPAGVQVHLDNLPADPEVPRQLDTADAIAASDAFVVEASQRTDPTQFDAVLPDCVLDPGLDRLRDEGFSLPVIGITELAAMAAVAVGGRLAAVARNAAIADELERRIRQYCLGSRFAGVHVLGLSFADIADDARWNAALDEAAKHFAGSGVTAILNGCSAVEVRVGSGVPVFDPTRAALTLLGAAHASRLVPLGGVR